MPYEGREERMDRMEAALVSFVRHTDQIIAEIRHDAAEFRAEVRTDAAASRHSLAEFRQGMAEFRAEVQQDIAEMRQWRVQAQKQWGEIAQKMGSFVEDIVAPNIPRLGREALGLGAPEDQLFSASRVRLQHPQDPSRMREFDYVYAAKTGWIVVESKSDLRLKDVDEFRAILAEAREYFPQYSSLPLYPVLASLFVPDHVVQYSTRHRIYALGMGPETMQLLNLSEVRAQAGPP